MDRELFTKLATEAGFGEGGGLWVMTDGGVEIGGLIVTDELWRFAQLVAQHCAERVEEAAADHEQIAPHEEPEEMRVRQVVYARHIRHAAGAVRLDFGLPLVKGPRPDEILGRKAR